MPITNFDRYWERLVNRVHRDREVLHGDEATFYRLTRIGAETYGGGVQGYFAERFAQFDADMAALESVGLHDLAEIYREARRVLYGDAPLDEAVVDAWLDRSDDDPRTLLEEDAVEALKERIGPYLDELEDVRDAFGLRAGLYEDG